MPKGSKNNSRFSDQSTKNRKPAYAGKRSVRNAGIKRRRLVRKKLQSEKAVSQAQGQLKRFRQGSILAVALTAFLLMLFTPGEAGYQEDNEQQSSPVQQELPDSVSIIENIAVDDLLNSEEASADTTPTLDENIGKAAKNEAIKTLRNLWEGFYSNLPKIIVAIATLLLAWLLVKLLRFILRRTLKRWESSGAVVTVVAICVWLLAIGIAISIVAGDIRALIGSLGLIGLALSWALQTPIESFTGWLLNSFRGYYRIGDRISVGDILGDVYKIDFLTTTVWEIGAPYRDGFVYAEQPTGRLITFPNNEILTGAVVNMTGDFPYVWDELSIGVANESDLRLAMKVIGRVAEDVFGECMKEPAENYEKILRKARLEYDVSEKPDVYLAARDSWTDIIVRYLVGARERRKWKSKLTLLISEEISKPEYKEKIIGVYPRRQVQIISPDGTPAKQEQQ